MSAHPGAPVGDLAPGYALGALDADERAAFEVHLTGCAECQAEVRAYEETAALLAHAAPHVAPPPALRARILAEARAAGQGARPGMAPAASTFDASTPAALGPRLVVADGGRAAAAPARGARPVAGRAPWLAAAAALMLAAGLGAGWARERAARTRAEVALGTRARDLLVPVRAELAGAVAAFRQEAAERRRLVAERDSVIAALTEPGVRVARLAATGEGAAMRLTWNRRRGVVVVAAAALPAPAAGRTYQLWGLTRGGAPQSLGVFQPDPDGSVRAVLHVPADAAMELAAVTNEPAGGSARPTSAPLMTGAIGAE